MPEIPSTRENFFPFEKLLADLVRGGVEFTVVGGIAISLNGFVRATDDVDILVQDAPANIRKLLDCLAGWGEGWARELKVEDFVPQEGSIRVMEEFDLDIFTRMRGHSLEAFRPRLRYLETSGVRIPYLAPEDLILLKQDSWREKDKLDVAAMRKILGR
jgi:predicted nucleotidyltransferase